MFNYSDRVKDHFLHPRHLGLLPDSDVDTATERLVVANAGHVTHGDALRLMLRIRVADERVMDARFQNFGTGMPIPSSSYLCSIIIGQTLTEALRISAKDLDRDLEGLPELKNRQPVLVLEALDDAVRSFRGQPPRDANPSDEPMLCTCFQVPASAIEKVIRLRELVSVAEVTAATRAGGGCQSCHSNIEAIFGRCRKFTYKVHISPAEYNAAHRLYGTPPPSAEELAHNPPPRPDRTARVAPDGFVYPQKSPVAELAGSRTLRRSKNPRPWKEMTHAERVRRIEEVLEHELRPAIRTDGGDIKLVALKDDKVLVTLHGHCRDCPSAPDTLKRGVEKRLREAVWPELEVEEVFAP
jgi:NifU-like protein